MKKYKKLRTAEGSTKGIKTLYKHFFPKNSVKSSLTKGKSLGIRMTGGLKADVMRQGGLQEHKTHTVDSTGMRVANVIRKSKY